VHERTLQSDFLMALLKDILANRRAQGRPLKVCGFYLFGMAGLCLS
jgi:HrpA-like RNA helicase